MGYTVTFDNKECNIVHAHDRIQVGRIMWKFVQTEDTKYDMCNRKFRYRTNKELGL